MMFSNPWHYIKGVFPFLEWTKDYDLDKAISDVIAGITVGLTLIPQSIAYASLAGLDPQVRLIFLFIDLLKIGVDCYKN